MLERDIAAEGVVVTRHRQSWIKAVGYLEERCRFRTADFPAANGQLLDMRIKNDAEAQES